MRTKCPIARTLATVTLLTWCGAFTLNPTVRAGVGDPQVRTDHPWYPGELACSSFDRLAKTQADLFERVVGHAPKNDEDRVLAAWMWRNTHYWHGQEGHEDLWNRGFDNSTDSATRDYWTGLFAHGYGLCGTTHAQWTAEIQHLLGHNRARVIGVSGHNSFEAFLKDSAYGTGQWSLLDHDVSTVLFDESGRKLLSIGDLQDDVRVLRGRTSRNASQNGWPVCGLHPDDWKAFDSYRTAEYFAGYAGPPPMVHLRRGETFRRFLKPGLEDGKSFVFWGRNDPTDGISGPQRARTWVNQPEMFYNSAPESGYQSGRAQYANAVFTYRPNFANGDYTEGVIEETDSHTTFEFQSPYIIAATPASDHEWGIYEPGCRNGLVIRSTVPIQISVSTDRGQSWQTEDAMQQHWDLTDAVKGHRQYWLRIHDRAERLVESELEIVTVCQCNSSTIPRLTSHGSTVEFAASGQAIISAGPNLDQAKAHRTAGDFDSPRLTLELTPPRNTTATQVFAAAHVASSNPPSPDVSYQIEYSTTDGQSWEPLVRNWRITRRGHEPPDFWSQSFCYGSKPLDAVDGPIAVRFRNDGGKRYRRAELHLVYQLPKTDPTRVTFHWREGDTSKTKSHRFERVDGQATQTWRVSTGQVDETLWVEYQPD
ncbi:hypothetical protein [Thalassoroseus pseudoceratinae]|uniref:hypothetical protein n=1 Tax=Thalassoroseus pseudoceratinae TaxID=2713176 RepID=UPI00141F8F76|nr:hypothetical protein [Thalassoroseus pseudoceratinae]